jgi:hypothetical protein
MRSLSPSYENRLRSFFSVAELTGIEGQVSLHPNREIPILLTHTLHSHLAMRCSNATSVSLTADENSTVREMCDHTGV